MGELRGSPDHAPATNLYYPGAGQYYFGYPPYFPFFTNTDVAAMGGSAQADALATEQFWTRMITFLNTSQSTSPSPPDPAIRFPAGRSGPSQNPSEEARHTAGSHGQDPHRSIRTVARCTRPGPRRGH